MPKTLLKLIGFVFIIGAFGYGLIYYFYLSRHIIIPTGETLTQDINLNKGTLELKENSVLQGNVEIKKGEIKAGEGAKILGKIMLEEGEIVTGKNSTLSQSIQIKEGELEIGEGSILAGDVFVGAGSVLVGKNTHLEKNLNLDKGILRIEEGVEIKGNVVVKEGETEKHSSAIIHGTKPKVYKTYDWPLALQHFDILPEAHKEQVGFILLTKGKNGLIREENVTDGSQYFDGIYDYSEGKLIRLDLTDAVLLDRFYKKAKSFFGTLPERRMVYFNVGATTKIYAHDPAFADIYLPSQGSGTLLIHEMGHVMDYKSDFSDLHNPKFPWTREDAVSGYGASHPGEDFAEAYRMYMMNEKGFLALIQENPERQKKYDFLKEFVFH